jgi:uncharacterized peroxidase-related enzyme
MLVHEGVDEDTARAHMDAVIADWRTAPDLSPADAALCAYADKSTRTPAEMGQADVDALRAHDLDDTAIHDATQVIAYFNYINRIADCLGVELEPEMGERPPSW